MGIKFKRPDVGIDLWSLFWGLNSLLEESPLNTSDGSPDSPNDSPPGGAFLGASLEGITCGSFRRLLDGSHDFPP